MTWITEWARQIAAYLIFTSVISNLIRKQNHAKYLRLVIGVVLILLLVKPVFTLLVQAENFEFHLSRYLLSEEESDAAFIDEICSVREDLTIKELETAVEERIETIGLGYGMKTTSVEIELDSEEGNYGRIKRMNLILESMEQSSMYFDTAKKPDLLRLRERLSEEFGVDKTNISITVR